ncbi:MAG: GH25 family lysozyme [Pseudomonadota bacterium]
MAAVFAVMVLGGASAAASEFNRPWKDKSRALVLDAYEFNEIDLTKVVTDQRVAGFIHKASDGMPEPYRCTGNTTERKMCRTRWRRYAVGKELYRTRRDLAKALGLKWGAYHLGRPGNPIQQAQHFLDYADPREDEIMVIDIEDNNSKKWMSLEDAETFARYIHRRTGRWPMLYTNGSTTKYIGLDRGKYPLLSRLPLWYARYRSSIDGFFPKGNWDTYTIWQFVAQINCGRRSCPYRVPGTNRDMDVNVVDMTVDELKEAWPFDELVPEKQSEAPILVAARPENPQLAALPPGLEVLMQAYGEHESLIDVGFGDEILAVRQRRSGKIGESDLAAVYETRGGEVQSGQNSGEPLTITVKPPEKRAPNAVNELY